jgi:hypothetical protein
MGYYSYSIIGIAFALMKTDRAGEAKGMTLEAASR